MYTAKQQLIHFICEMIRIYKVYIKITVKPILTKSRKHGPF